MDNPNTNYYQPSKGSLSGFDAVNLPLGNPDIVRTGWSIENLRAFLQNDAEINFPSEDWVRKVNELISSHLTDYSNPHKVSLDQIIGGFTQDVLGNLTPGTPPSTPPFFAYDAVCALPLGDVYPATYSSSNLYRMTESGAFVDPLTEDEVLGVDYGTGKAGIPLFSTITNVLSDSWSTNPASLMNTKIDAVSHQSINYPFSFFTVRETNSTGYFGVFLPYTPQPATVYTASFFVMASYVGGSLVISQPGDSNNSMTVNLADGSFSCSSLDVMGETYIFPSGIIKISFSYTTKQTPDSKIRITHLNDAASSSLREGHDTRLIFTIMSPIITQAPVNHPLPINGTTTAYTSPMVLNLAKASVPTTMATLLMTITLNLYPYLPLGKATDSIVMRFGALTIERDTTYLYCRVNGQTLFTSTILPGRNVISVSYSPTTIIFKDLAHLRQTKTGAYPALSTTTVTLGPCAGYLQELAFYALADTNKCVEYLTNG